jgi:hypothetical protein
MNNKVRNMNYFKRNVNIVKKVLLILSYGKFPKKHTEHHFRRYGNTF